MFFGHREDEFLLSLTHELGCSAVELCLWDALFYTLVTRGRVTHYFLSNPSDYFQPASDWTLDDGNQIADMFGVDRSATRGILAGLSERKPDGGWDGAVTIDVIVPLAQLLGISLTPQHQDFCRLVTFRRMISSDYS
jgi:hypothetical protein